MADTTTDKPRKIVVCHPDNFTEVNATVMAMALGDVLVQTNQYCPVGMTYIMDGGLLDG